MTVGAVPNKGDGEIRSESSLHFLFFSLNNINVCKYGIHRIAETFAASINLPCILSGFPEGNPRLKNLKQCADHKHTDDSGFAAYKCIHFWPLSTEISVEYTCALL